MIWICKKKLSFDKLLISFKKEIFLMKDVLTNGLRIIYSLLLMNEY